MIVAEAEEFVPDDGSGGSAPILQINVLDCRLTEVRRFLEDEVPDLFRLSHAALELVSTRTFSQVHNSKAVVKGELERQSE